MNTIVIYADIQIVVINRQFQSLKMSEDENQAFVMMTPDVGKLTFKRLTAQTVDGQYILTA